VSHRVHFRSKNRVKYFDLVDMPSPRVLSSQLTTCSVDLTNRDDNSFSTMENSNLDSSNVVDNVELESSRFSTTPEIAFKWINMGLPVVSGHSHDSNRFVGTTISKQNPIVGTLRSTSEISQKLRDRARQQHSFSSSTFHWTPFTLPTPPPLYSHSRRFRVCFGVMKDWQSAEDPATGRTYYFNVHTRETQWRKPMELASEDERAVMEEKERKQREFFAAMESNILLSMANGAVAVESPVVPKKESLRLKQQRSSLRPRIIRTISSMDEGTLKDMVQRTLSTRRFSKKSSTTSMRGAALEKIIEMDMEQSAFDFENSSLASLDESSKKLSNSRETKALQDLAKISNQMISVSDSYQDLEFSFSEGMDISLQDFTVSVSDALDFSSQNSKVNKKLATKKARESAFLNTLVFSPEITNIKKVDSSDKVEERSLECSIQDLMLDEKSTGSKKDSSFMESLVFQPDLFEKSKITENLEPGDIVFDPKVSNSKAEIIEPKIEMEDEALDLRGSLKARPKLVQRNSCGTIYVESTMSAPDKHATIKVCISDRILTFFLPFFFSLLLFTSS
jgi:WW domain